MLAHPVFKRAFTLKVSRTIAQDMERNNSPVLGQEQGLELGHTGATLRFHNERYNQTTGSEWNIWPCDGSLSGTPRCAPDVPHRTRSVQISQ